MSYTPFSFQAHHAAFDKMLTRPPQPATAVAHDATVVSLEKETISHS